MNFDLNLDLSSSQSHKQLNNSTNISTSQPEHHNHDDSGIALDDGVDMKFASDLQQQYAEYARSLQKENLREYPSTYDAFHQKGNFDQLSKNTEVSFKGHIL